MAKRTTAEEDEYHVVGVRMRITGNGSLDLQLESLSQVDIQTLVSVPMSLVTRFEPTRLANFQSQRIRLKGSTDLINEHFNIRRIIIFAKSVAVEYPAGAL